MVSVEALKKITGALVLKIYFPLPRRSRRHFDGVLVMARHLPV